MINLLEALNKINIEPSAEELADVLWLFSQVIKKHSLPKSNFDNLPNQKTFDSDPQKNKPLLETKKDNSSKNNEITPPSTIFSKSSSEIASTGTKGDSINIPRVSFLPNSLQIARALRPLMRRVPSKINKVFDELKTVDQLAETGILDPVLKPALERCFNVALIVEANSSMVIWEPMIAEFRLLLERQGAFQDIREFTLTTDKETGSVKLYKGAKYKATHLTLTSPQELIDPSKKCLTLIISDCISLGWKNGNVGRMLSVMEKTNLITIIQVLPQRLWSGTGLRQQGIPIYLQNPSLKTPNHSLKISKINPKFAKEPYKWLKVPILTLEPELINLWSKFLSGKNKILFPGFALNLNPETEPTGYSTNTSKSNSPNPNDENLIRRFVATASPIAQELASYFATTHLTVPIMRLVQHLMIPNSTQTHLAEVFLSGLIKQISSDKQSLSSNEITYNFVGDTRQLLLQKILPSQAEQVFINISNFIKDKANYLLDFQALIPNFASKEGSTINTDQLPLAIIDTSTLKKLGGNYTNFANNIEYSLQEMGVKPPSPKPIYSIEIVGDGSYYEDIELVVDKLNKVQNKFKFYLSKEQNSLIEMPFTDRYNTGSIFGILRNYRNNSKQSKPYLVAVLNKELFSDKYRYLFGSHEANEGLAAISLYNHKQYTNTSKYLCYYLIRYCLSFIKPTLLSHEETRGCLFDKKLNKKDILKSIHSPSLCSDCLINLQPEFDTQLSESYEKMVDVLKSISSKIPPEVTRYNNIPERNRFFTGRIDILNQLANLFIPNKHVAISGLVGIGKTQTALEFCYRHINNYQTILWVAAENEIRFNDSYFSIANLLNLIGNNSGALKTEDIIGLVKNWLANNHNWLMVLDDLEDPKLIKEYLPSNHQGHVLITTRSPSLGQIAIIPLNKMSLEVATLFLLKRANLVPVETQSLNEVSIVNEFLTNAKKIAELVDGLPLALRQAAAFIHETECSLSDYLIFYQQTLFDKQAKDLGEHPSVFATFKLNFDVIKENNRTAAKLLEICSFLDPDLIPEEIFTQTGKFLGDELSKLQSNNYEFNNCLKILLNYSLINRDLNNQSISIHRLVHSVIHNLIDDSEKKILVEFLINALDQLCSDKLESTNNWPQYKRLLTSIINLVSFINTLELKTLKAAYLFNRVSSYCRTQALFAQYLQFNQEALKIYQHHFGNNNEFVANTLNNIGNFYYEQGQYGTALSYLDNALNIQQEIKNADSSIIATLTNMGNVYKAQGRYSGALSYYNQALNIKKAFPSNNSLDTAFILHNIGEVYHQQGKYTEALDYYNQALDIRKRLFDNDHPDVANSLNNIAIIYIDQSKYTEALDCFQESLSIYRKYFPNIHPSIADVLNNIGEVYRNQGNYAEALAYYKESLSIKKQLFGDNHPSVALTLNNIAIIHDFQSNYIEALNDFQQALDIRKQTFGDDHPSVAATLNNISIIYDSQGRYTEALEYSQKALAIYQHYFGDNHPDIAQTFNNIATTYLNQHKYSEALKNFQQALSIFKNSFGDNHPLVASIINNIGEVYRNEGKYTEALEQYKQALSIRQQTLGANHPDIATNLNNIGLIYNAQGKYNEALSEFQQAINIRKEAFGNNHPAVASIIHNIGEVYRNQSKYTEALDHFQQALLLRKEAFGLSHPDISTSFNSIGATYAMQGDYEKALEYFFQALSVKKEVSGEIDIGVADIFNNISGVFFEQSKYKEALDYSFQALSIEKQLFGESHLELTNTLNNIANIYQVQNNHKEALNYYYQALSIKKQFLGDLHPDVATILIGIGIVYSKQDKYEQALEVCNQALSIKRQTLGDFHIDVASVLNNIGEIYRSQSKYTEALDFYLQSLSIKEKVLGSSHPSIADTLNNIAGFYANQADYQQALDFYNQALSIYNQNFGNSHSSIAQTLNNIASVYDGQTKFREALDFYNQALSIRKEIFGDSNPDVAQTLNDMGSVYLEQGNFQEALNLYNQALSIYKQFFGDSNLQVASTLNNIGNVYQNQEQYSEALEVYNQSLSIRKQIFGEYDLHVGESLNNISGVLIRLGKYEEALNYLQQTLTLYQQIFTKPHPNIAQTLSNIATVYLNQGNYKKAETHFLEALSIYEKVFGRNHLDTAKILHNLGLLYQTTNRNSQAATHFREALTIYNQFLPNNHSLIIQLLSSYNPVGTKINSSPSINRKLLFNQLTALVPGEFNQLLFEINPPSGLIPGTYAGQADRVIALLQWAESPYGCGLSKVQEVLEMILNPLVDIAMQTRSAVEQTINANQSTPYIRPNKDKIDFEKIAIGTIKSEPIYYTKKDISKEFWGNDQSSRRFTNLIYEAISESGYGLFEVEKAVNVVQQAFPDFWKNQTISNNLPNYNESIFPAKIIVEADLKITNQNDENIILYPKTIKQKPILFDIPENREKPAYCNINIELEEKTLTINKGTSQLAHLVITLEIDVTSLIANFLNHVNAYVFLRSGQQFLEFVTHQLKEQSLKVSFETNFGENIIAEFTLMIGKGLDKIKSPEIDIEEIIWAYEHINQVINPLDKIRIYQHSTKVNLNNSANIESRKQLEKELKEWQQEELIWLIKQGKDIWNNWKVRNKTITIDLSEQDLTNRLLPFTLTYFNLDNVNLEKSNLSNLHLGDVKLRNANLKQTKFNKAIIDLANFTGSNLDNSEIQDCRVVRADFTNISLKQANLRNTQFSSTTFNNVVFQETILESTQFSSCTIENCDFTNVVTPSNLTITEFLEILSKQNKIISQKYLKKQIIPKITFNSPKIIHIGVSELRALIPRVEILLLTVNDWERKALLSEMTPIDGKDGILQGALDRLTYRIGMFGNYCAAYTESTMGSGGRHGATLIAKIAVDELKPKAVLLLGIAFGINSNKQKLGDVLIAESIQPYEFQKVRNDFSITYRGQASPCGNILSERFRMRRDDWTPKHGDKSFDDVKVHQGLVLSGDKLVNNKDFKDALVKAFPTSIGGEMEGAGAYSAVSSPVEVILIKSICDWADGDKNDMAQPFAAFTAVSLAKHVLSKPDVLFPLINSHSQSQQDTQTYLNSTTSVNLVASHINKTTDAINGPSTNPKYSDQLILLLKQKFDSLVNKEPKQFLLGLEDFLSFINRDNSPIHIITSKLQNELLHQHTLIKNQFELQKNKAIEIKNNLIEQYPQMDDSHKDPSDFDEDFGSPDHYEFSFQRFNKILDDISSHCNYLIETLYKRNPLVDNLVSILKIRLKAYGIPSRQNPLIKDFDKQIWINFLDLEQEYNQTYKKWQHYYETSPSTALFRLKYTVSMINPNHMKESEFEELTTIEQSRYLIDRAVAELVFGWVKDILNQQNPQNSLNYSTNNRITSLKKDLEQVYNKIYEEMVLANHKKENTINNTMDVIELEEMILTKLHDIAQEKGYNRLVDLRKICNELGESDIMKVSDIAASLYRRGLILWIDSDSGAGGARITNEGSRVVLMGGKTGVIGKYRQNPSIVYNIDQSIKVGSINNSAFAAHSNSTAQQININPEIDKLFSELSKLIQNDPSSSNSDKKDAIEILSEVKNSLLSKALSFAKAKITLAGLKDMFPNTTQKIDQLIETIKEIY